MGRPPNAADALAEQARVHAPYDEQGALVGVYGHGQAPAFVLLVRGSRRGGLGSFESVFVHGLSPSGAGPAALEHRTEDGSATTAGWCGWPRQRASRSASSTTVRARG